MTNVSHDLLKVICVFSFSLVLVAVCGLLEHQYRFLHCMYISDLFQLYSILSISYSLSSVAHVWVPGAKTTGPIAKKNSFLKSNFSAVRNFKFQYDPFRNLKDVSRRSISKLYCLSKMVYFIFGYFSTKLGTSGHEQIMTWKCHWNRVINGREPILSKICIIANVQKNMILQYKFFYFSKTCAETWNSSLPKKLDLRKTELFCDWPGSFCSTQTCNRTKWI
jgi:hypothetical protein